VSYQLPWAPGSKVVELGGGDAPVFRPNVDVRFGAQTDFTADFGKPLPITSNEWDGVFSKFAIEHISWREVRVFISEVHRILKPGGVAVIIAPNLLAQTRRFVRAEEEGEMEDRWVCMLFGDLDYPENGHKCGFTPSYACRLFREAGFSSVTTIPFGDERTDMIIEARK
jgi:SAM-dependent methyltransferase